MIEQLKTIREFVESQRHVGRTKALTALAQLEAMAGEPVAWLYESPMPDGSVFVGASAERLKIGIGVTPDSKEYPLYRAAPVAQQYEAGDVASASAQGFRDGVASVAQQPSKATLEKLRAWETSGELIDRAWRVLQSQEKEIMRLEKMLAEERAQQPQAEAVPQKPKLIGWRTSDYLMETADKDKADNWSVHHEMLPIFEGDPYTKLAAAPQQAEAVPSDVVRDAERWRTFLATRPANTHAVINDAIDAAMAKGEKS